MTDSSPEREAARGPGRLLYLSLGLGLLWIFLALRTPDRTVHFMSHRSSGSGPLSNPAAAGAAVSGLTNALIGTGILAFNDALEGPSLLPFGDATVESIVFAFAGAGLGFVIGIWGRGKPAKE